MAVSPQQAARALRSFRSGMPIAVLRGLRKGMPIARKLAITKYMERKDNRGSTFDPPNPPPGPLGIRQGNLVRTVRIGDMRFTGKRIIASLAAGSESVLYAGIHERGGIIAVKGRSFIMPARPYLRPAVDEATPQIVLIVSKEVLILARATLKDVARING